MKCILINVFYFTARYMWRAPPRRARFILLVLRFTKIKGFSMAIALNWSLYSPYDLQIATFIYTVLFELSNSLNLNFKSC